MEFIRVLFRSALSSLARRCLAVATLLALTVGTPATAPAAFQCKPDLQGADDAPGQRCLTQECIDPVPGGGFDFVISFNFDETGFPGSNTGDACVLFDTDQDGLAKWALCTTPGADPDMLEEGRRFSLCN